LFNNIKTNFKDKIIYLFKNS